MIRAEPRGYPRGLGGLSMWVVLVAEVRRWVRRDKAWVVRVRARADEPFGPVLYEEEAAGGRAAGERVEALARDLRSGKPPWERTVTPPS